MRQGMVAGRRAAALRATALLAAALLAATLAACGLVDPYVLRPDEFNRDSPTFNKPLADGQPVSICYSGLVTDAQTVQGIADTQCAQYDKRAMLLSTDVARCPLLTPVEAMFACVAPAAADDAPTAMPVP